MKRRSLYLWTIGLPSADARCVQRRLGVVRPTDAAARRIGIRAAHRLSTWIIVVQENRSFDNLLCDVPGRQRRDVRLRKKDESFRVTSGSRASRHTKCPSGDLKIKLQTS